MERTILHADLNGFYASVESLYNPDYNDVPMAVIAGTPESRHGIILAKNELAKAYGVKTAETIWQAQKKCPDLVLAPAHHERYSHYSKLVNDIYREYTDLVESFGIDESWLDVTGTMHLFGDGKYIADTLRERVKSELGLTISVGVSFNKIFAKLGSDYKKPDATTVISLDNYKDIVFPLPVEFLLYVGKSAKRTLNSLGISTIGGLAESDRNLITNRLGKMGETLHDYANGMDQSPVDPNSNEDIKSVGNGITFRRNLTDMEDIKAAVSHLSDEVAFRMRRYGVKCRTVSVAIKTPEFTTISRQKTLENPTHLMKDIRDVSLKIIEESWQIGKPIRLLTITGSNLVAENEIIDQLSLFNEKNEHEKYEKIEKVMEELRGKYGKDAISYGMTEKDDIL